LYRTIIGKSKPRVGSGSGSSPTDKFNADVQKEVSSVLAGEYGREGAREDAITTLVAKYPDRTEEIKNIIYGNRVSPQVAFGGSAYGSIPGATYDSLDPSVKADFENNAGRSGGLLPDGYENRINIDTSYQGLSEADIATINQNISGMQAANKDEDEIIRYIRSQGGIPKDFGYPDD